MRPHPYDEQLTFVHDRKGEIAALDDLFARSEEYRQGHDYMELLDFINRLTRIAPFNALLVHIQRPGAVFVARAIDWNREFRRELKPEAHPMVILRAFGPVSFVFDVSDTVGPPLPDEILHPFATNGTLPGGVLKHTIDNCPRDGVAVLEEDFGSTLAGWASASGTSFEVSLNKNLTPEERYATLVHELGHIFCGHVGRSPDGWWSDRSKIPGDAREVEAESISYLVCRRLGLNTSSEKYLAEYVANHEEMPVVSMDAILINSGYIESMGKGNLPKRKPEHAGARVVHREGKSGRRGISQRMSPALTCSPDDNKDSHASRPRIYRTSMGIRVSAHATPFNLQNYTPHAG